jgi:hypothetical protein
MDSIHMDWELTEQALNVHKAGEADNLSLNYQSRATESLKADRRQERSRKGNYIIWILTWASEL